MNAASIPEASTGRVVMVRASVTPLHAEPRVSSAQVSQRLAGHSLRVLATDGDWLRVIGEDDYEGWVNRGYVADDRRDAAHVGSAASDRRLSLGCVVRDGATGATRALPLGAWVAGGERVVSGEALDTAARAERFPREARAIAATAVERFSGTPYQWGGVTPWGADCSGLVQTTFWLHGTALPRDASQQAEVGRDAGRELARLEPADLLFFSERADRQTTHVGIALGGARMVHLALGRGGYSVEQLDDRGDAYVAALMQRFVVARRVV
jgi:cell wall-associated NlpC family hydrolase